MTAMIPPPFPKPPATVQEALHDLRTLADGTPQEQAQLGNTDSLPRPWDPPTCHPEILTQLWPWLDQVAAWLNHEYAWRPATMIPPCWPRHPRLVRELAVLACLRAAAGCTGTPHELEDWHRYSLPAFIERMTTHLGEGGCRVGQHVDWPAAGRYQHFISPDATAQRQTLLGGMPGRTPQLRSV